MKKINKFKRVDKILLSGFLLTLLFTFIGFSADCENISEKVLRMHVLANSDTEYDQRVKIYVKDEVSLYAAQLVENAQDADEAQEVLIKNTQGIEKVANDALKEINVDYGATVRIDTAYFGTREYEDFVLPAGKYESLQVYLGDAAGQNWWCVVYPSLCISAASEDYEEFSKEEQDIIKNSDDYEISFKIYEWYIELKKFFSFE